MKYNFRQGIQHAPSTAGHPSFLTYNPGVNTVGISIGVDLVRATAAYGDYNYLIEERENASESWGPFDWNLAWGPEPVGNYTLYLYWDINRATGIPSRGFTPRAPLFGQEPVSPAVDQHWFDTATNTMKVWDGSVWRKVIRVFAASFTTGTTTITEYELGSQVGITNEIEDVNFWYDHGYILFGADQKGIRYNDTNFVTTATQVMTHHGSFSSPLRLELLNSTVLAVEPIPAFYAVSNTGNGTVQLANGLYVEKRPIGVTLRDVNPGEPVDIVTSGIVYNDQWNWNVVEGKDIYCGETGALVQGPVTFTNGAARVGTILGPQTILVNIHLYAIGGGSSPTTADSLFTFQVGVPDNGHIHYATLNKLDAEDLIHRTNSQLPVGDPLQPRGTITTETNGPVGDPHVHTLTIVFDYVNHTFVVIDITNNSLYNHEAHMVGAPLELKVVTLSGDYILETRNVNSLLRMNASVPSSFTVPPYVDAPFKIGDTVILSQVGTGATTIVPGAGVTINSPNSLTFGQRYGKVTITKVGPDEWDVEGNLAP